MMQTPTITALRRGFPDAHIALVAAPKVAPLFRSHPDIDELIAEPGPRSDKRAREEFARRLRSARWDLGLALPNSFSSALLLLRARAKRRRGYARDWRRLLLTEPVTLDSWLLNVHETEYYLHLLRGLVEVGPNARQPHLPPDQEAVAEAERGLAEGLTGSGLDGGSPRLLGILAGAAYGGAKRWLPERFAACAKALRDRHGLLPVLVGSENEAKISAKVAEMIGPPVLDTSGQISLAGLNALLGRMALFLTNDSGPMHLAAAQGTRTVAIFGSTNWRTTAPLGPCTRIVREPTACAPCLLRDCPIDHRCMEAVTAERVLAAAEELLAEPRRDGRGS